MRTITLFLFAALAVPSVDAASYQQKDGTIVDPIQSVSGGDLPYSGNNLEPGAELIFADLTGAVLWQADLRSADLSDANLTNVKFPKGYGKLPVEKKELSTTRLRGGQLPKEA